LILNSAGNTSSTGILKLAQTSNSSIESTLNADIAREDASIATQQKSLTTELNTANQILQSIPSQLQRINEIYSAITGYNKNG
jgi:flagellar hook-associated protein 2